MIEALFLVCLAVVIVILVVLCIMVSNLQDAVEEMYDAMGRAIAEVQYPVMNREQAWQAAKQMRAEQYEIDRRQTEKADRYENT